MTWSEYLSRLFVWLARNPQIMSGGPTDPKDPPPPPPPPGGGEDGGDQG